MNKFDEAVRRAKEVLTYRPPHPVVEKFNSCPCPPTKLEVELATAVVEMSEELGRWSDGKHLLHSAEQAERIQELESQLAEYKYRLQTWDDTHAEVLLQVQSQLATARKLIADEGGHWNEKWWADEADQFLAATKPAAESGVIGGYAGWAERGDDDLTRR